MYINSAFEMNAGCGGTYLKFSTALLVNLHVYNYSAKKHIAHLPTYIVLHKIASIYTYKFYLPETGQ